MDKNILLLEPKYKNKYPPLGLMKISAFHKSRGDKVTFAKGTLKEDNGMKWDRVYVSTLFTFEWDNTRKCIEYAFSVVKDDSQVFAGGVLATLMQEELKSKDPLTSNNIFAKLNIIPGLLNHKGTLGLDGEECIDSMIPDYGILDEIDYKYPAGDSYFLYTTRGCGMKCEFCAVQTLEPEYIPYVSIKEQIKGINAKYGPKKNLLLMDNNVLLSHSFNQIIDDLISLGFGKNNEYTDPATGKTTKRIVDFNQGLDANLLTDEKAKRLGELELNPARIAFDHIEDEAKYKKALELCAKNGVKSLSNYILYNGVDFKGKGVPYKADTPEDLYNRMRITMDFADELNEKYGADGRINVFSFPMRYAPLNAKDRTFIGTNWNKKYIRAFQKMLSPTRGTGVSSRKFFEADFGKSAEEFVENLTMPEDLLSMRGHFSHHKNEDKETQEYYAELAMTGHDYIDEWLRLYHSISSEEKKEYLDLIKDYDFSIEKFNTTKSLVLKKLFIYNMSVRSILKNIELLGDSILTYIKKDFPILYRDILIYIIMSTHLPSKYLYGMLRMQGKVFIDDIIKAYLDEVDFESSIFDTLFKAQKELNMKDIHDTRCLKDTIKSYLDDQLDDDDVRKVFTTFLFLGHKKAASILFNMVGPGELELVC